MKRWLITFGGADYDAITEKTIAHHPGADELLVYDDKWFLEHDFWKCPGNQWLKTHHYPRGCFWYCWKALSIIDALDKIGEGVVCYVDGDTYPIADLSPIFDTAERDGAMLFAANGHNHRQWCTEQCLFVMAQDEPKYRDAQAGVARFMAFRSGGWKERQFLYEWLTYCVNPYATTFDPPQEWRGMGAIGELAHPEHSNFNQHRTEQAILTNLAHKYQYPLHREACQTGQDHLGWPGNYPQLFVQVDQLNQWKAPNMGGSKYRRTP